MMIGLCSTNNIIIMKKIFVMDESGMIEYVPVAQKGIPKLNNASEKSSGTSPETNLLSIADLTKKFSVSRPTIYAWEKKGFLTRVQIGGRVLFDPKDIEELIDKRKVLTGS